MAPVASKIAFSYRSGRVTVMAGFSRRQLRAHIADGVTKTISTVESIS